MASEGVMGPLGGAFSVEWWEQKLSRGSCVKFMSKEVARSMWCFRRSFWNWLTRFERGEAARGLLRVSWILA